MRVRGGITYQGAQQLSTGTAECFEPDCWWSGPERASDPDEAHEDAERHRQETDSHVDCPHCDGLGRVPRDSPKAVPEQLRAILADEVPLADPDPDHDPAAHSHHSHVPTADVLDFSEDPKGEGTP